MNKLLTYLGFCPSKDSAQGFRERNNTLTLKQGVVGVGFSLILILLVGANNIYAGTRAMEIPRELFYLSAILFAVLVVVSFYRAYREKERFNYIVGGLCLLGLVWSILFVLDQAPLAGLFWLVAMIISVVMLPELVAFQDRQMREVDIESPLRVGELFSNTYSGWLKLANRHGLGVTVILYFLFFEVVTGGMLLALDLFYDLPSRFILIVLITGIFPVISLYRQIKRALNTVHLPSGSLAEK